MGEEEEAAVDTPAGAEATTIRGTAVEITAEDLLIMTGMISGLFLYYQLT